MNHPRPRTSEMTIRLCRSSGRPTVASIQKRDNGSWRARYRDYAGKEHARHFPRKIDAQRWLQEVTATIVTGTYVDPKSAQTTVRQWSEVWLKGYENNRPATVRQ